MTTGEIETNLDFRTLETINATSRTANKTLFDVSGLARYPDIEFLNNDHDFKQRDMFCRDGQGLSFKGTELLVSRIENVIQRMLSRAVPLDSAADYSESAPAAESRVHLTGGGSISSEDNVQDDFTSVIYSNCDVKLKHSEAAEMLDNPDISKLSNFPPFKPKGGSVYLLTDGQKIQNKDDWRADGYTWRNYGKNKVTNGDKIIEKSYFRIKNGKEESDNFQKVMLRYYGSDYNHITIVQYLGDETEYKGSSHGNRKHGFRPHKRTLPSVLDKIKSTGDENPKSVKDKIDSENSVPLKLTGINSIRNVKQVENAQYNSRKNKKFGHDSLYNLHELVYHLESYIHEIKTVPDLQVVIGYTDIFQEFDRLLQLKTNDPIPLYYDTTFCLGDFYVSTLAFQHIMFEENPVIPLAFMVHERKFQKCHEQFFEIIKEKIPRLGRKAIPIITDREAGIVNAIENVFPNAQLLICWNHILRDLKFWLSKHGATPKDVQFYDNQVKQLLQCESLENFESLFEEIRLPWSIPMTDYFNDNLRETIAKYAGRWILEEIDLYNPYSGITNNCSESVNAKLKRLTDWKEKEVDNIVLYLYYMQSNDIAELMKSFCGVGEMTLLKKYRYALKDPETIILPKRVCHPDKMIEMIKGELQLIDTEGPNLLTQDNESAEKAIGVEGNGFNGHEKPQNSSLSKQKLSQKSLAQETLRDHGITLVPEMKCFVVKGSHDNKYAVTLFPKETCNCPSTSRCRHILSAMMAIGMEPGPDKKPINLTQLRKNSRARKDKKAGTKRGRKGDVDETSVIAAPDSILMNDTLNDDYSAFAPENICSLSHSTPKIIKQRCTEFQSSSISSPKTPKTPKVVIVSPKRTPKSILKKSKKNLFEPLETDVPDPKRTKLEIPLLECSNSADIPDNDLVNLSDSRNDNVNLEDLPDVSPKNTRDQQTGIFWLPNLGLKISDKEAILNNDKINSEIIEAVNTLARNQFSSISGLQLPEKVPKYITKENRWHVQQNAVMSQIPNDKSLACQIHHTGRDHWVVSFRDETDSLFMFDSLGIERPTRFIMTPSLSIQLGLMYGKNTDQDLEIIIIDTQKQTNGVDCGVFAIAHLTEFCVKGTLNPTATFDTKKMRDHLHNCLNSGSLSCFPTVARRPNRSRYTTKHKSISVKLHCKCRLPECIGDMIKCASCKISYHKYCVDKHIDISCPKNKFICEKCLR